MKNAESRKAKLRVDSQNRDSFQLSPSTSSTHLLPARKKQTMHLETISQLLDAKLAPLATKEDSKQINARIEEMTKINIELRAEIEELKSANSFLMYKLESMDNRGRRNNLIFKGLYLNSGMDCSELIERFCVENLSISKQIHIN